MTRAEDYARVAILLNDTLLTRFDGYAADTVLSVPVLLPVKYLGKVNELQFVIRGRNPAAKPGYMVGLDRITRTAEWEN